MVQDLKKALLPYFDKEETEINNSILDLVETICKEQIEPYTKDMDKQGVRLENGKTIVHDQVHKILDSLRKNDIFGIPVPEKYSGVGLSQALYNTVIERIAQADASMAIYLALHGALVDYLIQFGTTEQKEKFIPDMAKGKRLSGFLYTEPGSGSDLGSVKTKAVREGDQYIVNGEKIFISNAGIADTYSLIVSTDPGKGTRGLSAFIFDARDQPGFKVTRLEEKMGLHASPTGAISFEDVKIPVQDRFGEENHGFSIILWGLTASRIGIASQAVGIANAAYEATLNYVNERKQFGRKIIDFQNTQFKLADMKVKINTARAAYLHATRLKELGKEFSQEASIAKYYGSEISNQVTYDSIQLHGGNGFIVDYNVERFYRDTRVTTIYEGTSEVQKMIISREEMKKVAKN
jgi:alkylation response protein AidB-like acyl-CoA dehydrogenase